MDFHHFEPARRASSLLDEFKAFAFKGNVVDLAIGVIIGGAFGKIVDALVKSVLMPLLAVITPSEGGYQSWVWTVRGKTIPYGQFLAEVINFLVVAAALFFFVKIFLNWAMKSRAQEKSQGKAPALTKEQELLTEIRDLLKANAGRCDADKTPDVEPGP